MPAATPISTHAPPAGPYIPSTTPVRIEIWDDARRQDAIRLWRQLETEWEHPRLTSSSDWVETWLKHFAALVPTRFLIGSRGDEVVGVALATIEPGPLGIRTWHLGTAGEPDEHSVCIEFNTLLVRPMDRNDFCREIQQTLLKRPDCDAVSWDGFDPADLPTGFAAGESWQTRIKPTFYFDLRRARDTKAEPLTLLGDSTRKNIRQNLRGADDLRVEWSETVGQVDEFYDELIGFHQVRWESAGEPGSFASSAFRDFHRDLLHRLVPQRRAAVVRVRIGGKAIGCTLLYLDRNRALVYQVGWSGVSGLRSPGLVNDYCCLTECLRQGLDAYDYMAGDSIHKRRMTTDEGRLLWAAFRKTKWKFESIDRLRAAKRFCQSLWTRSWPAPQRENAT